MTAATRTLRITTELPVSATRAAELARRPEVMRYVMSPILRMYRLEVPEVIEVGTQASARMWWLGVLPSWRHHLTVRRLDAREIYTHEYGGPVRTWNHRLTFEAIDADRCRYTDEIETDGGVRGAPTALFVKLMFRHRHRRWHRLLRDGAP